MKKILLAFVVASVTLAVADLLLRFILNEPVYQRAWREIPQLTRFNPNAAHEEAIVGDLGALTKEVADDAMRNVKTRIDSFGFRNDEAAGQSLIDLIILGDSFGFGDGTTQEKIFASLLRDRYGFDTYNLSLPHSGPWHEYVNLTLESKRLKLRKGAVVLWALFTGNDLDDRYGDLDVEQISRNGSLGRIWTSLDTVKNRSPIYQMLLQARYNLTGSLPPGAVNIIPMDFLNERKILFVKPYVEARKHGYQDIVAHPNYEALKKTVATMKKLAVKLEVSVKIVLVPTKEEVYGWVLDKSAPWSTPATPSGFSIALRKLCQDNGIAFLDLKPPFVVESKKYFANSGELLWWYDDTHWNELGHDLAASIIYRELLAPPVNSKRPRS